MTHRAEQKRPLATLRRCHPSAAAPGVLAGPAFQAVTITHDATTKHPLQVSFVGENGIDGGGLTREWFSLVSTALLGSRVLRRTENETAYEYYLNPLAQAEEDAAQAEFIGGFLAKALLETAVRERAVRHGLVTLGSLRLCTVLCAPSLPARACGPPLFKSHS